MQKTAIIVGATSGIGCGLAKKLYREGYRVVVTGRREHLLHEIVAELGENCFAYRMDVTDTGTARDCFEAILRDVGDVELVIVSAGTGSINLELDWSVEKGIIDVNVAGFAAISNAAFHYFHNRGSGHLVGISSIAGLRGLPHSVTYSASKSFCSTYLSGLRALAARDGKKITITDIRPGFVDTVLAQGPVIFWCASVEKAAEQIFNAIRRKKKVAYVSKRWALAALFLRLLPDTIFFKLTQKPFS